MGSRYVLTKRIDADLSQGFVSRRDFKGLRAPFFFFFPRCWLCLTVSFVKINDVLKRAASSVLFGFSPYLGWRLQYSLLRRPFSTSTLQGAKKQGRLRLFCVPPPFRHRILPFHSSGHHSPKNTEEWYLWKQRVYCFGEWGWEEMETRMVGSDTYNSLSALFALHNFGKLPGKLPIPPVYSPIIFCNFLGGKRVCSSDRDIAVLPGMTINTREWLNLRWCDSWAVTGWN